MYKVLQNGQIVATFNSPEEANAFILSLKAQGQNGISLSVTPKE